MKQTPAEVLDTILGYLGFACEIKEEFCDGHIVLQVLTQDANYLIGQEEKVLEDLQFLVNRILQAQDRNAPRIIVDVEHHRAIRNDAFVKKIKQLAKNIKTSGKFVQTDPLNSYDRRLVHNAFADDPELITVSESENARLKRVTIQLRERIE